MGITVRIPPEKNLGRDALLRCAGHLSLVRKDIAFSAHRRIQGLTLRLLSIMLLP